MSIKVKKKSSVISDSVYDEFTRFALNHKDYRWEPFMTIVDGQVVQNYKCDTRYETLIEDYRARNKSLLKRNG